MTVDTTKTFTVVTQFIESGGALSEIRRYYVQNGVLIPNSVSTISGLSGYNSISNAYCAAEATVFDDTSFTSKGGLAQMSKALAQPMVLVMSLWDDYYANMLWLDSTYPVGSTAAGAARGTCATSSGVPASVEAASPNAKVTYSNIKFGAINSTYTYTSVSGGSGSGSSTTLKTSTTTSKTSTASTTTTSKAPTTSAVAAYGQCGGTGYTGSTTCVSGYTCVYSSQWYSQCIPS